MASTGKCEYCGGVILSSDKTCPSCGAANLLYVEDAPSVVLTPHTIEELKEYCAERNMPLHRMRFFIGENYTKPKAFGIYQNSAGEFVVYKNKADGSRSIRYIGRDEEYAVKELYMKLLDECHKRNIWPDTPDGKPPKITRTVQDNGTPKKSKAWLIFLLGFFVLAVAGFGYAFLKALFISMGIFEEVKLGISSFLSFALYYVYNLIYVSIIQTDRNKQTGVQTTDKNTFSRKEAIFIGVLFAAAVTVLNLLLKHPVFYMDLLLLAGLSLFASWGFPLGLFLLKELLGSLSRKLLPKKKSAKKAKEASWKATAVLLAFCTLVITVIPIMEGNKKEGYYQTDDRIFYMIENDVYEYTDSGWDYTSYSSDYLDPGDYVYMYDDAWSDNWDMDSSDRFEDSYYYDDYHDSDSDYDSGSSYDSWDSGGTDWDSDW
ncbi:MAG: hypothetical protein J6J38_01630 [Lachnospiraceae bacterium]|nr:hypothetical protein [Lachnospiraceae bacterium]